MRIADMHCDTISEIWESKRRSKPQTLSQNNLHIDIQKMKQAGYLLQNFAMFVDLQKGLDPYAYVKKLIAVFYEEIEKNKNDIAVAKCYQDILNNKEQGKISALLTIEEGGCCKGQLENLELLYQFGARMMTLTWNYPNELGFPNIMQTQIQNENTPVANSLCGFDGTKGLTKTGFLFVEHMEELGIIVDVSHLSDAGFWDIARHAKKPFVASHSNARALCRHRRNLTDEMIRAIAEHGGVVGLNYYGVFLDEENGQYSSVAKIADHAQHIVQVGGQECLGLGSDFDGFDGGREMENCAQMEKLIAALEKKGFTGELLDNILNKNVLRVYREVL